MFKRNTARLAPSTSDGNRKDYLNLRGRFIVAPPFVTYQDEIQFMRVHVVV